MTDDEFDARYVALKALVEYANPLNWDVDENGIRRVWKEPGSETPEAYNGFELAKAALSTAAQPPAAPQEELREDASYESMNLSVMVLSDCGHSSNYTPLLERVAGRIDRHVERLLTAQRADLTRRAQAAPAPAAQGDALPREDFAWMVVQEACETEPADEYDPECIRILRRDLKSAVLAALLRHGAEAARAQPTPPAVAEPFTAAQRERMFRNRPSNVGKGLSLADWHRVLQHVEACHGIGIKKVGSNA